MLESIRKVIKKNYEGIVCNAKRSAEKMINICFLLGSVALVSFFSIDIFPKLQTEREYIYFSIVLCVLIVLLFFFSSLLFSKRPIKYEMVFFVSVLLWGIVYSLVLPPFSGHDEQVHFGAAYYLSNIFIHQDINMGLTGGRVEDVLATYGNGTDIFNISPSWYTTIANGNWFGVMEPGLENINMPLWTIEKWWEYLSLTIGIVIARGLRLGHWGLLFFSRFFNTIFVAAIGALSIRITPYAKNQMCFIAMVAGFARIFSSFNYDSIMIVIEMLMISISLKIYVEEKISMANILGILICMGYLVLHKIYLVILCFIPMYVIWKTLSKEIDKKKKIRNVAVGGLAVLTIFAISFIMKYEFWMSTFFGTNIPSTYLGNETYTIGYMICNPIDTLRIWANTFWTRGGFIFSDYFGGDAARELSVPFLISLLLALTLLVHAFCCGKKGDKSLKKLSIVIASVLLFIEIFGAQLRFTTIGAEYIGSFYARYTFPNFIVLLTMCGRTDSSGKDNTIRFIYYLENILLIIAVCFLLNAIFGREYYRYGGFLW